MGNSLCSKKVNSECNRIDRLPSPFRQSGSARLSTAGTGGNKESIGPSAGNSNSSNIPTPNCAALRKGVVDRSRLSVTSGGIPQHQGTVSGRGQSGNNSNSNHLAASRSTSPNVGASAATAAAVGASSHSFIPQPPGKAAAASVLRQPIADKHIKSNSCGLSKASSPSVVGSTANLRSNGQVTTTVAANCTSTVPLSGGGGGGSAAAAALGNKSMLEKFKFFNSKDKSDKGGGGAGAVSKRTSSSSGFSSARSERSDSSNSICSDSKGGGGGCSSSTTPTTTTSGDTQPNSPIRHHVPTPSESSPKIAVKAFARKTFGRALNGSKESVNKQAVSSSPKSSRKLQPASEKPVQSASAATVNNNSNNSEPCKQSCRNGVITPTIKVPAATHTNSKEESTAASVNYAVAIQPDNPIRESKIATLVAKAPTESLLNTKRSTSKDSLSSECSRAQMSTSSGSQSVSSGGGTSIPKPTAAVKGTTKVSKTLSAGAASQGSNMSGTSGTAKSALKSIVSKGGHATSYKTDGCSQVDFSQLVVDGNGGGGGGVATMTVSSPSSSLLRAEKRSSVNTPINVSIAMVSPMPSSTSCDDHGRPPKPNYVKVDIGQMLKPGQQRMVIGSTTTVPLATTRSKVETTFDSTDEVITRETNSMRLTPTKETTFSEENEDVLVNVKPMQPLLRASPYGYMRSLGTAGGGTYSSARALVPSLHVSRLGLSRHLFTHHDPTAIYGSGALKRLAALDGDYGASDVDSVDFSGGYMSDGDVLRGGSMRGDDIGSGYMSEGGASLYSRRLQSRLRENMATVKEGVSSKSAYVHDDMARTGGHIRHGLDDSSSVSSGLSDTIAEVSTDENHTGSSVSSEHNAYGSLKRTPYDSSSHHHHHHHKSCPSGNGQSDKGRRNQFPSSSSSTSSVTYQNQKTVNSRSVHKSDSSQQTESSAFRPNPNSTFSSKRVNGDSDPDGRVELLRRGKSDLEGGRLKHSNKLDVPNDGSASAGILRKIGSSGNCCDRRDSGSEYKRKAASSSSKKEDCRKQDGYGMDREREGRSRSTRSGSVEPQCSVGGSSGNPMMSAHHGKGQSLRGGMNNAAAATALDCSAAATSSSSRRPNSTCSVSSSSNGGNRNGGSGTGGMYRTNSKKSSDDRLGEMDGTSYFDQAALAQLSGIPRPGSAQPRLESLSSCSLERRSRGRLNASNAQMLQDLYGIGTASDVEYGHSSLGRRHKQYNFGTSTIPPTSKDFSMLSGSTHGRHYHNHHNHHQQHHLSNGPRLSLSKGQDATGEHPSAYSVTFATEPNSSSSHVGNASPYSWLRRSPSNVSSISSLPNPRTAGGSLTEAESMESLASTTSSSIQAQIQHARANSLTHACLMLHQRQSPSPRVARSNSIRSTKSEKLYPSMMQRSEDLDAYLGAQMSASVHADGHNVSQPTSPTADGSQNSARYARMMGGSQSVTSSPYHGASRVSGTVPSFVGNVLAKMGNKDDELHTSSLSLASVNSSLYSTPEEKHNREIRKLRRELADAHDKVKVLTSQLSTNTPWQSSGTAVQLQKGSPGQSQDWQAHVVAAFEQSLSNMTNRLQALTHTAEQKVTKDSELNELRSTIESLRKQSAEAGLTSANFTLALESPQCFRRQPSTAGGNDTSSSEHGMSRQLSTDSMSSINSVSSVASHKSSDTNSASSKNKKKKKGWLRSSFTKAFSRGKKTRNGSLSDVEDMRQMQSDISTPNSPLMSSPHSMNGTAMGIKTSHSSSAIYDKEDDPLAPEMVKELKKQLREKDMVLTDIRLEALSSAHQLESLKETVTKMRTEMLTLKYDNERLQRMVSTKSLTSSQSSLTTTDNQSDRRMSASDVSAPTNLDMLLCDVAADRDGKRVTVSVYLNCHGDSEKNAAITEVSSSTEVPVGTAFVSGKTKWDLLDGMVRRAFKEYILRVDPTSNLGLNADSVQCYQLGEVLISKESELPELLPCGYLVGDQLSIKVTLKGTKQNSVDSLAFDTLIPKSIVQRYVSLLTEHRRIILCGPSGTGKTYLAHKLAEFLVLRSGKQLTPGSIATFNVDHKSAKELRQYLSNVAEQCESSNASDLPSVIILDNLHHVGSLGEVFNGFLSAKYQKCPYIIGTMNHTTCSTTNLQLHHNFRWVLCANHMEPVKGFLGRHLRRKLVASEVRSNSRNADLVKVIDWIPKVWLQLNKFLETHSSSDVTIGPRLFMSCPIDISGSQVWFTDLWNYSVVPYLLEAVREGLQLYGRRAPWEDPTDWVIDSYPWLSNGPSALDWPSLLKLRPEDVGYEGHPGPGGLGAKSVCSNQSDIDGDPLFNMLMRLQEAASCSSPHSNDSDTTSQNSHTSSMQPDDGGYGGGEPQTESAL